MMRHFKIIAFLWFFCLLILEIFLRFYLVGFSRDFFLPENGMLREYYPEIMPVLQTDIKKNGLQKNILILGGSVVSPGYSGLENRLDTMLTPHFPEGTQLRIFNLAVPAHSSLDNVRKYALLKEKQFDLVIYYEAINESRFNNISTKLFREDYSHVRWYRDFSLLLRHPELNFTVIPYALHLIYTRLGDRLHPGSLLELDQVEKQNLQYGDTIKSASSYRRNIETLVSIAASRNDKLLLISYTSYFPEGITLTGEESDMKYFAGCRFASPVTIWGTPDHVRKSIAAHNRQLEEVALSRGVRYLDMKSLFPARQEYFCDVCHFSEEGARLFARTLRDYILKENIIHAK